MPPKNQNVELAKPQHHYAAAESSLDQSYRRAMNQLSYTDYAQHPEKLPAGTTKVKVSEIMQDMAQKMLSLHFIAALKHYGLELKGDLGNLARHSNSFEAFKTAYEENPERYYKGQNAPEIGRHLAELYDAAVRDKECRPVAIRSLSTLFANYKLPELTPQQTQPLAGLDNDLQMLHWLRSSDEQRQIAARRESIKRAVGEKIIDELSADASGTNRWASVLMRKPRMHPEERQAIRQINDSNPVHKLALADRYLEELEKMGNAELKKYDWADYHNRGRAQHEYNGQLTLDITMMLSDLNNLMKEYGSKLDPEDSQVIKKYTDVLNANSLFTAQEDDMLLNPNSMMLKLENIKNDDDFAAIMSVLPNTVWAKGVTTNGVNYILAKQGMDNQKNLKAVDYDRYLQAIGRIRKDIQGILQREEEKQKNAEQQLQKKQADAEGAQKAAAAAQGSRLNAGSGTDVYLVHAQEVMGDDPAVNNAYAGFSRAMKSLTDYTASLSRPGADGKVPPVTQNVIHQLEKKYHDAEERAVNLIIISAAKRKKEERGLRDSVQMILNLLQKDRKIFAGFDPERKLTFPQMLNAVHSEFIDAGKMGKGVVKSGQMSQRLAMNVKIADPDGKEHYAKGLFTVEDRLNGYQPLKDIMKKYKLDPDSSAQERSVMQQHLAEIVGKLGQTDPHHLADGLEDIAPERNKGGKIDHFKVKNNTTVSPAMSIWLNGVLNAADPETLELFEKFRMELINANGKIRTYRYAGVPDHARLDQRNSAMSAVAKLLGKENLLCKSRPMMMKRDGKLVKGTFMEFSDLENAGEFNIAFKGANNSSFDNEGFVRSASDLQVLDFICGNVDRHGSNMFYKVKNVEKNVNDLQEKKVEISGVQGIDNDLSFGIIEDDVLLGKDFITNFKGLSNMRIITEQTANTVKRLTPEMLKAVLSPYGLTQPEMDAACHRLDLLKKSLDDTFSRNPELFNQKMDVLRSGHETKVFQPGKLYILKDDQVKAMAPFASYLLHGKEDRFGKMQPVNIFTAAMQTCFNRATEISRHEAFNEPMPQKDHTPLPETTLSEQKISAPDAGQMADDLKQHVQELERQNKGAFVSSQEYKNLLNYAKIMQKQLEGMRNQRPTRQNTLLTHSMIENLTYLNQVYMDKKDLDGSLQNSRTANNRYHAVRTLQDTLAGYSSDMHVDFRSDFCRLSALQRAGAFRNTADSAEIADIIKGMNSQEHLTFVNSQICSLFNAVSERAYRQTFEEYRKSLEQHPQLGSNAVSGPKSADTPQSTLNKQMEAVCKVMDEQPKNVDGMKKLQDAFAELRSQINGKNGYLNSVKKQLQRDGQMTKVSAGNLISAHELLHLADAAGRNSASPKKEFRERIAERMTRMHLLAQPELLKQENAYERTYNEYLQHPALTVMTAGKSLDRIKKYVSEPEKDFAKHWQKANVRAQKLRENIPAPEIQVEEIHI